MKFQETSKGDALYLNQQIQFHHVFDRLLDKIERADKMIVSSFAVTEAIVRRLSKKPLPDKPHQPFSGFYDCIQEHGNCLFAGANVDELYLVNNHSKTIWVKSESGCEYLAVMSNNATNNHRFECGFICSDPEVISFYLTQVDQMKLESMLFDGRQ